MDTKNQQNNFNNPVVIILLLALIGLGGYFIFSRNSSNDVENKITDSSNIPTTQDIVTNTQIPAVEPKPKSVPQATTNTETKKVASVAEAQACAQQSKAEYDSEVSAVTQNGLYPINGTWSYSNHLNANQGKCFRVEILYGNPGSAYAGLGKGLYDVYENKNIASYNETGPNNVVTCSIKGVYGCTKAQFSAFLNSEMESTTY